MKSMYHVILAGGSGARFWPKSRKDTPKQLLKIILPTMEILLLTGRKELLPIIDELISILLKRPMQFVLTHFPAIG